MAQDAFDAHYEEMMGTLKRTDDRLRELVRQSMDRVLAGSSDRESMQLAYAALRGEVGAAEGLDALRTALTADGLDRATIDHIEGLYLNVLVGV